MEERWRDVKGYEGLYLISDLGRIKSLPKKTRRGVRLLIPQKLRAGYLGIDLCRNKKIKRHLVHRLVAEAFLSNPHDKEQVNHISGVKNDNTLLNLEWATRSENQKHSIDIGLRHTRGLNNSQSKLTEQEVLAIRESGKANFVIKKQIAKKYNISVSTIYDIVKKRSWGHI